MLDKAISITAQAFEGKFDKGGNPYILHCLTVMNAIKHLGEEAMCAAVMHDLVEDTDYTPKKLIELGFSNEVVTWVDILTHKQTDTYDIYIKSISLSKIATAIKLADLRHNSDILRMKGLRKKDFDRIEKYHRSFMYLSK